MTAALALGIWGGLAPGEALAGDVVVHALAEDAAALAAAEQAGAAPGAEVARFATVIQGAPVVVEGGAALPCPGARATRTTVEGAVEKARAAYLYGEYDEARAQAHGAIEALACLDVPPSPDLAAGAWLLLGVVDAVDGRVEQATAEFRVAKGVLPGLAWDPDFPDAPRPLFEAAVPGTPVQLRVVAPTAGGVWVDGRPDSASAEVAPGWHVVHVGGVGLTVDLQPGTGATLVVPSAFSVDALASESARADVAALLAASFGEGRALWVVVPDHVYSATAGRTDWRERASAEVPGGEAKRRVGLPVLLTGVAVTVAGGTSFLVLDRVARKERSERISHCSGDWTETECDDARRRYNGLVVGSYASAAAGWTGVALGITGAILLAGEGRARPAVVDGLPGMVVRF